MAENSGPKFFITWSVAAIAIIMVFVYFVIYRNTVVEEEKSTSSSRSIVFEEKTKFSPKFPEKSRISDEGILKQLNRIETNQLELRKEYMGKGQMTTVAPCNNTVQSILSKLEGINYSLTSDELRKKFRQHILANRGYLGLSDAELLVPILSSIYLKDLDISVTHMPIPKKGKKERNPPKSWSFFIDIGANVGRTSSFFVDFFSDKRCRAISRINPDYKQVHPASCRQINEIIIAFEPSDDNWQLLIKAAEDGNWKIAPWIGIKSAVSNNDGVVSFYSDGDGDEQGSLDSKAGLTDYRQPVRVLQLDTLFYDKRQLSFNLPNMEQNASQPITFGDINKLDSALSGQNWKIYFLKIDVEGYDYNVIQGAWKLLQAKKIRFLVFEYTSKWSSNDRNNTIKFAVAELATINYICFSITPTNLIPISQIFWDDNYEIDAGYWSNFFCVHRMDPDLPRIVRFYNRDIDIYFLKFMQ